MVVVGIPGKPVQRSGPEPSPHRPDLAHDVMPDVISERLDRILDRLSDVERAVRENGNGAPARVVVDGLDPDYAI
jgi:hypothetical protein